jgi:hypothetical protein
VWLSQLSSPSDRSTYEAAARTSRLSTISAKDIDITQRSQKILDQYFPELASSHSNIMMMKTALSYHHTLHPSEFPDLLSTTASSVISPIYFIICPLISVFGGTTSDDLSQIIEGFTALLSRSRCYFSPLWSSDSREKNLSYDFGSKVCTMLNDECPELVEHIRRVALSDGSSAMSTATLDEQSKQLEIVNPLGYFVERLGVGYLRTVRALIYTSLHLMRICGFL